MCIFDKLKTLITVLVEPSAVRTFLCKSNKSSLHESPLSIDDIYARGNVIFMDFPMATCVDTFSGPEPSRNARERAGISEMRDRERDKIRPERWSTALQRSAFYFAF